MDSYSESLNGSTIFRYKNKEIPTKDVDEIKKVLPYLSYIQEHYAKKLQLFKEGIFTDLDTGLKVYNFINSETKEYPTITQIQEAGFLLKAFIEINQTLRVPKWFKAYYEEHQALKLLEG